MAKPVKIGKVDSFTARWTMLNKVRLWVRGNLMLSYHNAKIDGVDLFVRPIGWRRYLRFYPYSQGNRVRFCIGIKKGQTKPSPLGRIAIYEDLLLPEWSQKERYPLLTDPYSEAEGHGSPQFLNIIGSIISIAGQGRYTINHPTSKDATEIVSFDAKHDATMFMWLTPTIIAIVGTITSIILWVFFGKG